MGCRVPDPPYLRRQVSELYRNPTPGEDKLRRLFAAAIAVLVLVPCGVALASAEVHSSYHLKLRSKAPSAASGFDITARFSDAGTPNMAPKILTGLDIKFPVGTRFDLTRHPVCRSTMKPIEKKGLVGVCPPKSQYGTGTAKVILGTTPLTFPIHSYILDPVGFDGGKTRIEFDVVLNPKSANPLGFFFGPDISGSNFDVGLPDDAKFMIHPILFDLHFPASTIDGHAVLRTPPTCPSSRHWTASFTASFIDHTKQTKTIMLPCGS
jgi:hypothetical protein